MVLGMFSEAILLEDNGSSDLHTVCSRGLVGGYILFQEAGPLYICQHCDSCKGQLQLCSHCGELENILTMIILVFYYDKK